MASSSDLASENVHVSPSSPSVNCAAPSCAHLDISEQPRPSPNSASSCDHCPRSCGDAPPLSTPECSEDEKERGVVPCQHESQASRIQSEVRQIMRSEATSAEKAARIHALFLVQREAILSKPSAVKAHQFRGFGAPTKCPHYERKCWIKAECCHKYYACPRCHDEHEAHDIDVKSIRHIGCVLCGDFDQPLAPTCRACGAKFARYFCEPCRMFNDAKDKDCYHCDDCGICRQGKGLGIDNFHCHKCDSCWPLEAKESHPCRPGNLDNNCPICQEQLATTTEDVYVLDCAHAIHRECFDQYVRAGNFACPLCSKSLMTKNVMEDWYRKIDERLLLDEIPEEFKRKKSRIFCNDCETKSTAPFHFRFHKCADCNGYNTTVLHQFDQDEQQDEDRSPDESIPPPPPAPPPTDSPIRAPDCITIGNDNDSNSSLVDT